MEYENLLVAHEGPVATVTINRPKALNALSSKTVTELLELSTELEMDPGVRVIILTGGGDKAFVAGADIAEMAEMRPREARHFAELGGALMTAVEASDKPWIAAVNGFALGGGCELALACDFIYAARGAKLGQPEVGLGVIPGFGGTQRLMRRVGIAKAKEMIFTGDLVDADEALRIGLVTKVVPGDQLLDEARATARKIAAGPPLTQQLSKRSIHRGLGYDWKTLGEYQQAMGDVLWETEDHMEGVHSFLEKREPDFRGR